MTVNTFQSVTVSWDDVVRADTYAVYRSDEPEFDVADATWEETNSLEVILTGLPAGEVLYFAVAAINAVGEGPVSVKVSAMPRVSFQPTGKLNDTGLDWFASVDEGYLDEAPEGFEGQDASYGRDALATAGLLEKTGEGQAGFDFTKLGTDGNPLAEQDLSYAVAPWVCVLDNTTGLMWEVKTVEGIQSENNTYSWYNDNPSTNGGVSGYSDGGTCEGGISCDTAAYIETINQMALGGFSDWRLPTVEELRSLVDYSIYGNGMVNSPCLDEHYFPNTAARDYWTATSYDADPERAFAIDFQTRLDVLPKKSGAVDDGGRIRLVRGDSTTTVSSDHFTDNQDGSVTDQVTGLTRQKCTLGQVYNVETGSCDGEAEGLTWQQALGAAMDVNSNGGSAGIASWRVPNIKELASIVDYQSSSPAINKDVFPETPNDVFWSSTTKAGFLGRSFRRTTIMLRP